MRVGIGGPVGTGKSSLIAELCRALSGELEVGVVTNDIYTTEDAEFLRSTGVLPVERIVAVQTGCCPHTAIRDDVTANLEAVEQLELDHGRLDIVLVESGGDNLTAVFGPALADVQIFVLDCAGGDDVPRKGGPGITRSDLLVINKTDLAPYVGADVEVMLAGARSHRGDLPVLPISLRQGGAAQVAAWVVHQLEHHRTGTLTTVDVGPPVPHFHADGDGELYGHSH
ncbi:Urease accessory protein UreG [Paraconexibacter sp. AEG42_29]|uniref:Urease accessory protein UreG n=1 Tax=Paraconexibacter sp. AEG42_29 TaxID=2997339 RepID=A0AAU7B1C3_9ACTN